MLGLQPDISVSCFFQSVIIERTFWRSLANVSKSFMWNSARLVSCVVDGGVERGVLSSYFLILEKPQQSGLIKTNI